MFLFNIFKTNNINSDKNQNGRPIQIDTLDGYLFHKLSQNLLGAAEPALPLPPKVVDIGDVNNDMEINEQDYEDLLDLIRQQKKEWTPEERKQFERADLNKDGDLTLNDDIVGSKKKLSDANILRLRIYGINAEGGDFNCDGLVDSADLDIIQKYVNWVNNPDDKTNPEVRLSEAEKKFIGDTKDVMDKYLKEFKERLYVTKAKGDVNGDQKIDEKDVDFARTGFLTDEEKKACDFDDNEQFDQDDINALNHLLIDKVEGDINGDGKIDGADLNILINADGKMHLLSKAQMKAAGINSYDKTEIKEAIKKLGKRLALQKTGDVDGQEGLTTNDYVELGEIIKKIDKNTWILTDAEKVAFDFDGDGRVDKDDVIALKKRFEVKAMGDINGDGVIDDKDINMLERYLPPHQEILLTKQEFDAADLNHNGKVDKEDLYELVKWIHPGSVS